MLQRKSLVSSRNTSDKVLKILLFVFSFLLVLTVVLAPFFINVKVECKSQFGECPTEINSKLEILNSKSLSVGKSEIKKILKQEPSITDYSIQFKLPNTLLVNLIVKKPEFAIANPTTKNYFLIDSDGRVVSITQNSVLPTVVVDGINVKMGQTVDPSILFALHLIGGVFEMYQTNLGTIQDNSLVVDLGSQIRVIFPLDGDFEVLLGSLRLIYPKVTTGDSAGKYSQIDLRFKNPVLR